MPCAAPSAPRLHRSRNMWGAVPRRLPLSNPLDHRQNLAQLSAAPPKGVTPLAAHGVISEPLATRRFHGAFGSHCVIHTKANAVVLSKIEFGQVARQVLFANVLVRADQTALKQAEIALCTVCVDGVLLTFARPPRVVV